MDLFEEFTKTSKLGKQIYPILFQDDNYYVWMPPSQFLVEMQMSTHDRMEKLRSLNKNKPHSRWKRIQISPEIIVFQNYQPEITQDISFSIMNTTQKMLSFKVIFDKTTIFQLRPEKSVIQLAPGMKTVINVLFTPLSYKDYLHKIVLETLREDVTLPIICIGPRPMLDIPDKVMLPTTPVKKESTSTFIISNIGIISAILSLKSTTYFRISPQKMFLPPGERAEITVHFKTNYPGNMEEDLLITLESGEQLISKLCCRCLVLDVFLQRAVVDFPKTYVETINKEEIKIVNKSQHCLKFAWMKDKIKLNNNMCVALGTKKFSDSETDVNRNNNDKKKVSDNIFMYEDEHFEVTPICEEIPPFSEQTIIIVFTSNSVGKFHSTAYCEVSGSVERLPLMMTATCLGPSIVLDPTHIVVDLMFGKLYKFSVTLVNQGEIDGEVIFKKLGSNFGTRITCDPSQFLIKVDEKITVSLTLSAHNPGPYIDDACFEIQKSWEILKLTLKGVVSSPKIRIEPTTLSYGDIPIGFKAIENLSIKNLSEVAFDLYFKIPTDGKDTSCVDVEDMEGVNDKPMLPDDPKEFTVIPEYCTLYPTEVKDIVVQLIPGIQRLQETLLELTFHESESNPMTIPLQYNAVYPNVLSTTPNITLNNCYIRCQVISTITLQNLSNVKGYFYSVCEPNESTDIECNVLPSEGVFNANRQFCLDLFLKCNILGKASKTIRIQILGSPSPITICELDMTGIGPKISCTPKFLNWGELSLLHKSSKTITLYNLCPIDATFKCHFKNRTSPWDVNIKHGLLKADESIDIIVSVFLKDADNYADKLFIEIHHGRNLVVPVTAKGVNSCIVMEPTSGSLMDLGQHFTLKKNKVSVMLKNFGTKTHSIRWSNVNELLRKKEHVARQKFYFNPQEFKLASLESIVVNIEFYSEEEMTVEEHWYMFGVIEYGRKEMLKEVDLTTTFIKPSIEKSKDSIFFEINRGFGEQQFFVLDYVFLKNTSPLDLNLSISTNPPFQLVCEKSLESRSDPHVCASMLTNIIGKSLPANLTNGGHDKVEKIVSSIENNSNDLNNILKKFAEIFSLVQRSSFTIEKGARVCVNILFNENVTQNKKSQLVKDTLNIFFEENPCMDSISLVGEVNIPDVELSPAHILLECKPSQTATINFKVKNITPLTVKYQLLYHKFNEKIASRKTPAPKNTKKKCHVDNDSKQFVTKIVENYLSKGLFSSEHKNYNEMESILLSIVGLFPNTDSEENDNSYRKILDTDPKKKYINNLLTHTFVENIIFNNFLNCCTDFACEILPANVKISNEKHREIEASLNGLITLNRREGELPPFSCQEITTLFKPSRAVDMNLKLMCLIECGVPKYLNVRAISGEVQFTLDKDVVDFGVCLYYETYTQTVTVNNSGSVSFEFTISHPDEAEIYSNNPWQSKIMEISPNFGKLSAGQSITLFIKISPGIYGKFEKSIKFNLTDYKPVVVPIIGIGTFPQVDINTDYSYKNEIAPALQYNSISNLTEEWLNINKITNSKKMHQNTCVQNFTCKSCQLEGGRCCHGEDVGSIDNTLSHSFNEQKNNKHIPEVSHEALGDDWVVIPNNVKDEILFPTLADIKFTVERSLISEQVDSPNANNIVNCSFYTFKRFLDFGVVTYDQIVKRKLDLIGYSICNVNLKIINKQELPPWIKVTIPKVFNEECAVKKMVATVSFNSNKPAAKVRNDLSCLIYVQVVHGAIIPIEAKVTLVLPTLQVKSQVVDFGSVLCGNLKVCSIPIVNCGLISCNWSATFLSKSYSISTSKGFPFQIHNRSGVLKCNEHNFIRLSYRPKKKEQSAYTLSISVEHNTNNIEIDLLGIGQYSAFDLVGSNIDFVMALPYSTTQESLFGISNPNEFPIHIQFHESKRIRDLKGLNHQLKAIEEDNKLQEILGDDTVFNKFDTELWNRCETVQVNKFGTFIICHQTGINDNFHLIRKIRNETGLPLISIDNLLLSCIASQETESCTSIRKAISQTYMDVTNKIFEKNYEDEEDRLENEITRIYSHYCETNTDITGTNRKLATRKSKIIKVNLLSDKLSSASSCSINSDKVFNFSEELILDVLRHSFNKYKYKGCIINDLNCMFIESQSLTLKYILQTLPSTAFAHFVIIHDKTDESHHRSSHSKAKEQIAQKNSSKLLKIVDNWDLINNCVVLTSKRNRFKEKRGISTSKRINKKNVLLKNEDKNEPGSVVNQDIGIPSWVLTSNNISVISFMLSIIRKQMEAMKYNCILNRNHTFAEYSQKLEDTGFKFDDEPFKIYSMEQACAYSSDSEHLTNDGNTQTSQIVANKSTSDGIGKSCNFQSNNTDKSETICIPAKSLWNLKIVFEPQTIGTFLKTFHITSQGSNEIKDVLISGVCDIPRVTDDPYLMFSKVVESANTTFTCPAYDASGNILNFGSIFCKYCKESTPIKEMFNFKNISSMDVVISFTFLQPRSCFTVSPERLIIPPKKSEKAVITVRPKASGTFSNTLICSINENPSPYQIRLTGLGVLPMFKLSQDTLEFGKLLLYRQEIKSIYLTNSCALPLQWKIRNLKDFKDNLFVSKETCCLGGMSSEEVKFYYGGNNPMVLKNAALYIDIYEKPTSKDEEPRFLVSKTIKVSLECYDVSFDCTFHPEHENHVNFGKIVVGASKTRKVFFTNKGTYSLIFKIIKSESSKVKLCVDDVTVKPSTGLLKANDSPICIEMTWKASYEVQLVEYPLLNCHLVDVAEQQKTIALFPLKVSVQSYFNK